MSFGLAVILLNGVIHCNEVIAKNCFDSFPIPIAYVTNHYSFDGSIILHDDYSFYYLSCGGLAKTIGGKGEGPGKFQSIGKAVWTGSYYFCTDDYTGQINLFNENGLFQKKLDGRFGNLIFPVKDGPLFVVTITLPGNEDEPKFLVFSDPDNKINLDNPTLRFHVLDQDSRVFKLNNTQCFLTFWQEGWVVIEEVNPTLYFYNNKFQLNKKLPIQLPSFVSIHEKGQAPNYSNPRALAKWMNSWSRIFNIFSNNNELFILYSSPDIGPLLAKVDVNSGKADLLMRLYKSIPPDVDEDIQWVLGVEENEVILIKETNGSEVFFEVLRKTIE